MYKIESLKDYLNESNNYQFIELVLKLYRITDFICLDYPDYKKWFFTKQIEGITGDNRNILFIRNPDNSSEIIAIECLKKDDEEKKICTLYVKDEYRGVGIGSLLVEEAMKWLGTKKPLITITDYKLDMFRPIINKYNWELKQVVSNLYNNETMELIFNRKVK